MNKSVVLKHIQYAPEINVTGSICNNVGEISKKFQIALFMS